MAIGFALLTISPLHEKSVYEKLGNISEIIEIHPLFGEFDILVKIQCPDIDSIGGVVINKIRALKGVVDTVVAQVLAKLAQTTPPETGKV